MDENRIQYVDMDAALERVRGNKTLYRRMLGLFINDGAFEQLENAFLTKDCEECSRIAHGIKGMTGNLSFPLLFETSTQMMLKFREGVYDEQLIAAYRDVLEKTLRYVREVMAELDA